MRAWTKLHWLASPFAIFSVSFTQKIGQNASLTLIVIDYLNTVLLISHILTVLVVAVSKSLPPPGVSLDPTDIQAIVRMLPESMELTHKVFGGAERSGLPRSSGWIQPQPENDG
jgi:hypothetical protein